MIENDPRESHLEYQPAPERPHDFDKRLKQIVGLCPTGEPYLRFSWGMDVTEILDGMIIRRYPDPEGKCIGLPYWVLEGWQSPDVYDKQQWQDNEDLLGPFPSNGVWDFIAIVQDEQKRYMPLGSFALQMARDWRHWRSKDRSRAIEELLKARCANRVVQEKQAEERRKEIQDELIRDISRLERGGYDPRKRTLIAKITKGEYQQTPGGMLVPKLA